MPKPEILFLAHRIPYPPDKGDKIRSWRMLSHLAAQFDVHLGCFVDDPADMEHADFLRTITKSAAFIPVHPMIARLKCLPALVSGRPLSFAYFNDGRMGAYVKKVRKLPLAAEVAFSSSMAPYLARPVKGRARIVDLCDADSEKWREYAETARGLMKGVYALEAERLADAETRIINWADETLAISAPEARILGSHEGATKTVGCFANGVDAEFFSSDAAMPDNFQTFDVVFVGAMDYRANAEAALWFAHYVWPLVREKSPGATFGIIGPRPGAPIKMLDGRNGVTVTGRVEDVRPYIRNAGAAVAPLRVARGVQNKVLEAMAMARPVVATSGAHEGIEAIAGEEIVVADAPGAFADAVSLLLADRARGDSIGAAARARVVADFTWPARLGELDAALVRAGVRF